MKLPAGTMVYALVLVLLMGLVSVSLLLYQQLYTTQVQQLALGDRLVLNSGSGIQWLLAQDNLDSTTPQPMDLFGEGKDSVTLSASRWGVFQLLRSVAHSNGRTHHRAALAGMLGNRETTALYLADHNKALALCGRTVVKGNALLPAAGPKRAYIEGQTFLGSKLIQGDVGVSQRQLPPLPPGLLEELNTLKANSNTSAAAVAWESLPLVDTIPWLGAPITAFAPQSIDLSQVHLKGQLIIQSAVAIHVGANSTLTDVILVAPTITIASGFEGVLQAVATDSLAIGADVHLNYPSALTLLPNALVPQPGRMTVEESCIIEGVVLAEASAGRYPTRVRIAPNTEIMGQVYINGQLDLRGNVYGSLYTGSFYLATPSATYENHLLNATIDRSKRPEAFIGIGLREAPRGIIKWLNG